MIGLVGVGSGGIGRPAGALAQRQEVQISSVDEAIRVARSPESSEAALRAAAAALTEAYERPLAVESLLHLLGPERAAPVRMIAAEAIAKGPFGPPRGLVPGLAECLSSEDMGLVRSALRALGRYQSREAVRVVLDGLLSRERASAPEVVAQAYSTLAKQTGMSEFGADEARWRQWWSRAQWLTEQEWRTQIGRAQAATAEQLRRQRSEALRQVVDLYRRLHAAATEQSRSELLVEMLGLAEPEVRRLGLELTTRALLNGKAIDDAVARAVAARLTDAETWARAEAASILERLNKPEYREAIREALRVERDAEAATALLRAARFEPDRVVVEAALDWLARGAPASEAAIGALLAANSTGALRDEELRLEARERLERLYPHLLSANGLRLLIALDGGAEVVALLASEDPEQATVAAVALVDWEPAVEALVEAAKGNGALREHAARALMRHRLTSDGFAMAQELARPETQESWEFLLQFARALPDAALLRVASAEEDLARREQLLAHAVEPEAMARVSDPSRVEVLVLALQTRLALGRAADALAALDETPSEWFGPRLRALRVTALLCLGRIDDASAYTREAMELGADGAMMRAWVDALSHSIDKPFASRIRERLIAEFPGAAESAEGVRLAQLTERLPKQEAAAENGGNGADQVEPEEAREAPAPPG